MCLADLINATKLLGDSVGKQQSKALNKIAVLEHITVCQQ